MTDITGRREGWFNKLEYVGVDWLGRALISISLISYGKNLSN